MSDNDCTAVLLRKRLWWIKDLYTHGFINPWVDTRFPNRGSHPSTTDNELSTLFLDYCSIQILSLSDTYEDILPFEHRPTAAILRRIFCIPHGSTDSDEDNLEEVIQWPSLSRLCPFSGMSVALGI